jgi:hypothetical protein
MTIEARERIQKLIVTGDNRLKQGVAIRPLVERRLADLERLAGGSAPPAPPDA